MPPSYEVALRPRSPPLLPAHLEVMRGSPYDTTLPPVRPEAEGAVVGGKDDQGVVELPGLHEGVEQARHRVVELAGEGQVAAHVVVDCGVVGKGARVEPLEAAGRVHRSVHREVGDVDEPGLLVGEPHEALGLPGHELGGAPSRLVQARAVAVPGPLQLALAVGVLPGVGCPGQRPVGVVESHLPGPVPGVEAHVPLAAQEGPVARLPEGPGQGHGVRGKGGGVGGGQGVEARGVAAGHERRPGRRALGGDVVLAQLEPLRRQTVDRRSEGPAAVVAHVAPAEVVGQDEEDVGARFGRRRGESRRSPRQGQREEDEETSRHQGLAPTARARSAACAAAARPRPRAAGPRR